MHAYCVPKEEKSVKKTDGIATLLFYYPNNASVTIIIQKPTINAKVAPR